MFFCAAKPSLSHIRGMCHVLFRRIHPGWASSSVWVSLFDLPLAHVAPSRDAAVAATLGLADGKGFYSLPHLRLVFPLM